MNFGTNVSKKPFVLTMLAPAASCNQHCPNCYLTEVRHEPVDSFALTPDDFAQVLRELRESGTDVITVCFQGFEVTLPQSWPYAEAVFSEALKDDIRRCFVTNGMRLHALIDRIVALDPARIAVSIDGSDNETNDRHRGLPGALKRTLKSLDIFLGAAPKMRERMMVASVLYEQSNFKSLLAMPALLAERNITRWGVGLEVKAMDGDIRLAEDPRHIIGQLEALERAAHQHDISFFVGDEFGLVDVFDIKRDFIKSLPDHVDFLRLLPSGHAYWGKDSMREKAQPDDPCWLPRSEKFLSFLDRCREIDEAA